MSVRVLENTKRRQTYGLASFCGDNPLFCRIWSTHEVDHILWNSLVTI